MGTHLLPDGNMWKPLSHFVRPGGSLLWNAPLRSRCLTWLWDWLPVPHLERQGQPPWNQGEGAPPSALAGVIRG